MQGRLLACLAALAAAPAASALPLAAVPVSGNAADYYGVAVQDSRDERIDWPAPWWGVCAQAPAHVSVTLAVLAGSGGDTLALDVPGLGGGTTLVRVGETATIEAVQGDGCPDFTVRGIAVQAGAPFRAQASSWGV